ncbi:MAG: hypothetical protein IPM83_08235 [Ignavibacteria bacterium]|nr:hypothetical protein [Ignavibacteria bacterium]
MQREVRVEDVAAVPQHSSVGYEHTLDGVVIKENRLLIWAPITGESTPAAKATGDTVRRHSTEDGFLEVRVTSVSSKSTLARIVQ